MAPHPAQLATPNLSVDQRTPAAQTLGHILRTVTATSCPKTYNFHLHTIHSDGQLQPEAIAQQAIDHGLQGLAVTDHHTTQGYRLTRQWFEDWQWKTGQTPPHLWTGIEITADLLATEVHILGYGFDPQSPKLQPYLHGRALTGVAHQAQQAIRAIQGAGGLAVLAHPARYRRPATDLIPAAVELGIDGVETYYAYQNAIPWRSSPRQTEQVSSLSQAYGLLNTCGTDTHGLNILQRL